MSTAISATMKNAVTFACEHGGLLLRTPGGYWGAAPEHKRGILSAVTFGTKTVEALVARGLADYTEWKEGRNGRFPVRMTLRPSAIALYCAEETP